MGLPLKAEKIYILPIFSPAELKLFRKIIRISMNNAKPSLMMWKTQKQRHNWVNPSFMDQICKMLATVKMNRVNKVG